MVVVDRKKFQIEDVLYELRVIRLPYPPGPGEDWKHRLGLFSKSADEFNNPKAEWEEISDPQQFLAVLGVMLP